jgi:hypothetical protein
MTIHYRHAGDWGSAFVQCGAGIPEDSPELVHTHRSRSA